MARRGELREVELVDDEIAGPPAAAERRRIPVRRIVAGALVLGVGLATVQWVLAERERAAVAELGRVPGVISPVDDVLVVERRIPARGVGALFGDAGSLDRAADGSQTYTWHGGLSGRESWSTPLRGPDPVLAEQAASTIVGGSWCVDDSRGGDVTSASRVVCLVSDGAVLVDPGGGGVVDRLLASTHEVIVLSSADGAVLARWPVDGGDTVAVLPDDTVAVAYDSPVGTTLTGFDALSGEQRWSRTDPFVEGVIYSEIVPSALLSRTGDLLAYSPTGGPLRLLSPEGEVVRDLTEEVGTGAEGIGWTTEDDRISWTDGLRTTILAPDGDPAGDVTVGGSRVDPGVDDGSVPGLLLTRDAMLRGWDAGTGSARWSNDTVVDAWHALIMRGRVFVAGSSGVRALDGTTGRLLWSATVGRGWNDGSTMFTDGRHLLVPVDGVSPDESSRLVAYDPATGQEVFRVDYPTGVSHVGPVGRNLVGLDLATNEYLVLG